MFLYLKLLYPYKINTLTCLQHSPPLLFIPKNQLIFNYSRKTEKLQTSNVKTLKLNHFFSQETKSWTEYLCGHKYSVKLAFVAMHLF